MLGNNFVRGAFRDHIALVLLVVLLVVLLFAGGASRADVLGQVVVRAVAWATLAAALLLGVRPRFVEFKPLLIILGATAALPLLHLVPLPPALWQALPGREPAIEITALLGKGDEWRAFSLVPDGTINALFSLSVPFVVLTLVAGMREAERAWLPTVLLLLVTISMLIGLLQFSGVGVGNPLINDSRYHVSSTFANRNHFALFLAVGALVAPIWAFGGTGGERAASSRRSEAGRARASRPSRRRRASGPIASWRMPVALGLVLLFGLAILATGSRAGMLVGAISIIAGLFIVRRPAIQMMMNAPRWAFPAAIAGLGAIVAMVVLVAVITGRAASIERALTLDVGQDLRFEALPVALDMIRQYFPAGSGFGSFDPVFRIAEPFAMLRTTYFNHVHNDFVEVAIEGGLPAVLVLAAALAWWVRATWRSWRQGVPDALARAGSVAILAILIASIFDYPARTPMIMAVIVIVASWLCVPPRTPEASALPSSPSQL